jgi:putative FmdB family regulatory protein
MPKYEYACRSCGQHLEVVQSFTDEPLTECPACGGPLRKVFSAPAITFKGSGFYRTDNRSGSRSSESKPAETKADSSSSEGKDGKGETPKTESTKSDAAPKTTEAKTA